MFYQQAAAERATLQKEGQVQPTSASLFTKLIFDKKNDPFWYIQFKLRGLQKHIEEMEKRLEFKSSLERSFDSLQVGNTGCR